MACDLPSSSWSHSRGFQLGSGLDIGLAMTGSWSGGPPSAPWLTWLCSMEHCPAEKKILRFWEHCQSRRKQVFFQHNLVRGLNYVPFTKTNVPHSSLSEAPPYHHQFSTKFHSGYETLWLVGLFMSPSKMTWWWIDDSSEMVQSLRFLFFCKPQLGFSLVLIEGFFLA